MAMSMAKRTGRNRVILFPVPPGMTGAKKISDGRGA